MSAHGVEAEVEGLVKVDIARGDVEELWGIPQPVLDLAFVFEILLAHDRGGVCRIQDTQFETNRLALIVGDEMVAEGIHS